MPGFKYFRWYLNGARSLQGVWSPRLERCIKIDLGVSRSSTAGARKLGEKLVGHVGLEVVS